MAADYETTATEQWIREILQLNHPYLADVRSLRLPGTHKKKISHLGDALKNFICLRALDLSYNALTTIKGIEHLKGLERLILYFNCISSLDVLKELYELPALRELDLRLNPLIRRHPHYRLTLVYNMHQLDTLDDRPVSERERTAATMQFSSEHLSLQQSTWLNLATEKRSSEHVTKKLPLQTTCYDIVSDFSTAQEETKGEESKDFTEQLSSSPKQKNAKCISGSSPSKCDKESKPPHTRETSHQRITSPTVTEPSKESFGPVQIGRSVSAEQRKSGLPIQTRHIARGYYTPNPNQSHHSNSLLVNICPPYPPPGLSLSDPSNPARLINCNVNTTEGGPGIQPHEETRKTGGYRKPLEMLLNLVDKHWTGERSLQHHNNFLSQAVHILSMMEKEVSTRESEVETLRGKVDTLNVRASKQTDEQETEVPNLSDQLQDARSEVSSLREQLRNVLAENASLQKQLLGLERRHFRRTRSSPIVQMEEAKADVEELRKEMERLKERVEEAGKSRDRLVGGRGVVGDEDAVSM